jgi:hypothetical protein
MPQFSRRSAAYKPLSPFLSACLNAFSHAGLGEMVKVQPEITFKSGRVSKAGKPLPDGIEIRFGNTVPSNAYRALLKNAGFRFSEKQQMWYAYDNATTRAFAEQYATELVEALPIPENGSAEKNWFYAKVRGYAEYQRIAEAAPLKLVNPNAGTGYTRHYPNKGALEKEYTVARIKDAISGDMLYFKKYFTRARPDGPPSTAATPEDLSIIELEAEAEIELMKMRNQRLKAGLPVLSGLSRRPKNYPRLKTELLRLRI